MESKQVSWTANALAMVYEVYEYIESSQGEAKAEEYMNALLGFGNSLEFKSEHFSYCRHAKLQEKQYRCAIFRKTHVIIYSETTQSVDILAVIHIRRSPEIFEQTGEA